MFSSFIRFKSESFHWSRQNDCINSCPFNVLKRIKIEHELMQLTNIKLKNHFYICNYEILFNVRNKRHNRASCLELRINQLPFNIIIIESFKFNVKLQPT